MEQQQNTLKPANFLRSRMYSIMESLDCDTSESRGLIAYLRRSPEDLSYATDAWSIIYRNDSDDDTRRLNDKESQSVYDAIRLYARHRRFSENAHKNYSDGGLSVIRVIAEYRKTSEGENIDPKVSAILSSGDHHRAVNLVFPLFTRAVKISKNSVDYIQFANELHSLHYPESRRKVLLKWGKEYYRMSSGIKKGNSENSSDNS